MLSVCVALSAELGTGFSESDVVSDLTAKQVTPRADQGHRDCDWIPCAPVSSPSQRLCDAVFRRLALPRQVHQLTALLRVAKFKAPSADCLSPAGEYNLRLGIMKARSLHWVPVVPTDRRCALGVGGTVVRGLSGKGWCAAAAWIGIGLTVVVMAGSVVVARRCNRGACVQEVSPDFVATHSESPSVVDGHPFIVEAGVSLGGKRAKEGITVYRFANRIPLLFEGGGDVVTRTAMKRIKYGNWWWRVVSVFECECVYICVYVRVWVCMSVCMCVRVNVFTCVDVRGCAWVWVCAGRDSRRRFPR